MSSVLALLTIVALIGKMYNVLAFLAMVGLVVVAYYIVVAYYLDKKYEKIRRELLAKVQEEDRLSNL